jgi:hypothetical protein
MKAVVDRIEGNIAVVLVGENETRLDVPLRYLPDGARESTILSLGFVVNADETAAALDRARERIERLKRLSGK